VVKCIFWVHAKFGLGTVAVVESNSRVAVDFDRAGRKGTGLHLIFLKSHRDRQIFLEQALFNIAKRRNMPKIRRNDPCLCGSGKKHKKCCMGKK
jgi:uncharacterized protein YchJ